MKHGQTPPVQEIHRYGGVAIAFHWVLALAILGAFAVGLYLEGQPFSPAKLKLINWHKWAGVTILALSVLRLLWRVTHRPPALPAAIQAAMPRWQHLAHHGTCYFGNLADVVELAPSTTSQHVKVLKDAGLVMGSAEEQRTCYCVNRDRVAMLKRLVEAL